MKNYTSTIDVSKIRTRWFLEMSSAPKEEYNKVEEEQNTILDEFIKKINKIKENYVFSDSDSKQILFNKGRYIEFSCSSRTQKKFIMRSAKLKEESYLKDSLLVVAGLDRIEAVINALCKQNVKATIRLGWI